MGIVNLEDHTDKESGGINWETYHKAEEENGSRCYRCGSYVIFGPGYPQLCGECKRLDEDTSRVNSSKYVRCPKCKSQMSVYDLEDYNLYQEGHHDFCCDACNHDFEIVTTVSYSFDSPELIKEEDNADN